MGELKKGNSSAFEELYLEFHPRLYGFCLNLTGNHQDAEGLAQEVFISVWENRDRLDVEKSFGGFVFRCAKNRFLNTVKHRLTHEVYMMYASERKNGDNDLRKEVVANELAEIIRNSIESLPQRTKRVFILSRFRGLKYKEIAKKMDLSENVVDHELRKALGVLKEDLSGFLT